jgi:hypothetical protein
MSKDFPVVRTEPLHVLTFRLSLADQSEVARAIAEHLPRVADVIDGPPMALRTGFPKDGVAPFDLAFPIREPIEREGFVLKTLPEIPVFSIVHEGVLKDGPEGTNLADTWQEFVAFLGDKNLLLGDDPTRFIYHEGVETVGTETEHVRLEVQLSYHWPMWLEAFREGVTGCLGAEAAERVLAGSDALEESLDGPQAAEWVQSAVDRLDREADDEQARACVLNGCAHHYIVQSAELMQAAWDEVGHDLRALMKKMTDEPFLGGKYWLDESGDEPRIFIQRRPARMEAYEKASDPVEKRYHACFCPLVRDAIREGKEVSRTFCHCSGGWYVQEWEIVFGKKPEVELVETMLEGADACVFAVKVPERFL